MDHQKHTQLARPKMGHYARKEIAFVGAPCGVIKKLVQTVQEHIGDNYEIGFMDADHASQNHESRTLPYFQTTDKIGYFQHEYTNPEVNPYQLRQLHNHLDLLIVNGNHFPSASQIVMIHQKKERSLQKRLSQLTDIKAVILCHGMDQPFEFLDIGRDVPIFSIDDHESLLNIIGKYLVPAVVKGLVLAGGKSTRMGQDKALLNYHGKPQVEYLHGVLLDHIPEVHVSVRKEIEDYRSMNQLADQMPDLGPFGAITSAFRYDPNTAWLVVACDLPFVQTDAVEHILSKRNPSKIATAYLNEQTGFPDPLFTIWEPRAYPVMLHFLSMGYSCPRKVLINSDIQLLPVENKKWLMNVNRPDEFQVALVNLQQEKTAIK